MAHYNKSAHRSLSTESAAEQSFYLLALFLPDKSD